VVGVNGTIRSMSNPADNPDDWRSRPRKPAASRRTKRLSIRVTESELERLHELADADGRPLSDFIIRACLGKRAR